MGESLSLVKMNASTKDRSKESPRHGEGEGVMRPSD